MFFRKPKSFYPPVVKLSRKSSPIPTIYAERISYALCGILPIYTCSPKCEPYTAFSTRTSNTFQPSYHYILNVKAARNNAQPSVSTLRRVGLSVDGTASLTYWAFVVAVQ